MKCEEDGRGINGDRRRDVRGVRRLGFVWLFVAYMLAVAAGYGLLAAVYRLTGTPPGFWSHMLTGAATFGMLNGVLLLARTALRVWGRRGRSGDDRHMGLHRQLTDALGEIAQGNFDVLLETNEGDVHSELAGAINDMARNLGTLEMMRQDFISNVSHEIQSPLTSIGGFAALLQKKELPEDLRRRYAGIIEAESRRLSSLSENLLKLTSLEHDKAPLRREMLRLDKQLEDVALTLEPQWSVKGVVLEADLQRATLYADADLLLQVWMNLLHNAIKFTPPDGRVHIGLAVDGDENVTVTVSDTGAGIGAEDLPHIFERFYKADKARDRALGGNGLGLSIAKRIVGLHGGEIAVQSTPGEGTVFTVLLPHGRQEA